MLFRFKVFERIADAGFGRLMRILGILVHTVLIKKLTFRKALAVLQPLLKPVSEVFFYINEPFLSFS
jgi:hypothetical protein